MHLSDQNGTQAFGSTVGRVANRIFKSRFVLDGKAYRLFPNDGNNSIHGMLHISLQLFFPNAYAWFDLDALR
jgi:galactose mutarotase-like enzyme